MPSHGIHVPIFGLWDIHRGRRIIAGRESGLIRALSWSSAMVSWCATWCCASSEAGIAKSTGPFCFSFRAESWRLTPGRQLRVPAADLGICTYKAIKNKACLFYQLTRNSPSRCFKLPSNHQVSGVLRAGGDSLQQFALISVLPEHCSHHQC